MGCFALRRPAVVKRDCTPGRAIAMKVGRINSESRLPHVCEILSRLRR
jgi:hypothetical protein